MTHRSTLRRAAIAAAFALATTTAFAQQYPAKPVRVIVPFPPGGSADLVARTVGQKFSENTKQPWIVENRPGADTIIAMQAVKSAPADGYTVGYAIGSALTMNPTLYSNLPYDPNKDFTPVTLIVNNPLALVVHPSVPAKTAKELADYIKANPGKLFYGQANIVAKVATESFSAAAGGKMVEVAYKGSTPNIQDLLLGRVQVAIEPVATVLPGYSFNNWHAIVLPAGTPREVVSALQAEVARAAKDKDVTARLAGVGIEVIAGTPEELAKRAAAERDHWSKQIKALGIKVE
jgi:tripartite-type tricarboxylate transporter receptor subunit TctC